MGSISHRRKCTCGADYALCELHYVLHLRCPIVRTVRYMKKCLIARTIARSMNNTAIMAITQLNDR